MADFPFHAVLFDCDGVLVDSEPITNRVLNEMLGELGWHMSVEETMRIFVGKVVRDEATLIEARTGFAVTTDWLMQFRARRNAALDLELSAIPGAPQTVRALLRTLDGRIAVASGADRIKVELQLAKAGILDTFEGRIFSGHETPRNKPYPDVYLAAAAGLGVDSKNARSLKTPSPAQRPAWLRERPSSVIARRNSAIAAPRRCMARAWSTCFATWPSCPRCSPVGAARCRELPNVL